MSINGSYRTNLPPAAGGVGGYFSPQAVEASLGTGVSLVGCQTEPPGSFLAILSHPAPV